MAAVLYAFEKRWQQMHALRPSTTTKSMRLHRIFWAAALVLTVAFAGLGVHNFRLNQRNFQQALYSEARSVEQTFSLLHEETLNTMLLIATFIANDRVIQSLFWAARQALEQSQADDPHNDPAVVRARDALLRRVQPNWLAIQRDFRVRQLHFAVHPGAFSLLRVHSPENYGDSLASVRHSIVATDATRTPQKGFEAGRVYAGLRGVVPVFIQQPRYTRYSGIHPTLLDRGEAIQQSLSSLPSEASPAGTSHTGVDSTGTYIGTLEAGTSYDLMLATLTKSIPYEAAVLLERDHISDVMWADRVQEHFISRRDCACFVEASSSERIHALMSYADQEFGNPALSMEQLELDEHHYILISFPLRDYLGQQNPERLAVGRVVLWRDISELRAALWQQQSTNIALTALAWLGALAALTLGMRWGTHKLRQEIIEQTAALRDSEARFKDLATHDELTGVANRHAFFQYGSAQIAQAQQQHSPLTLLMLDIDHFKHINDNYGHSQGDEALRQFASLCTLILRSQDLLGRIGGEEFAVLLEAPIEQSFAVAERLRQSVAQQQLQTTYGSLRLTVSIGLTVIVPEDSLESALWRADQALYAAKSQGRNQVMSHLGLYSRKALLDHNFEMRPSSVSSSSE